MSTLDGEQKMRGTDKAQSPNCPPTYGYEGDPAHYAYMYPLSPPIPFYYCSDYDSYPGSPSLLPYPASPPMNPVNPSVAMLPHAHAYFIPPLHMPSPAASTAPTAPMPESQYHSLNIYVRGLEDTTTDESFLKLCETHGKVRSSKAILDQKTSTCKGYGFVMYETESDCQKALECLNKAGLQASFARVGQESFSSRLRHLQDETSTNLYISNLPLSMTEQTLEALFLPHRTLSSRILRDPRSGISRGVGFARLADRASALAVVETFNGHTLDGSSAPLQVRFADSPAQKKLKTHTTRQRIFRRDVHSAGGVSGGFPAHMAMPVTPEAMLGFAPMYPSYPFPDQQPYVYPPPLALMMGRYGPTHIEALASPPEDALAVELEQKLSIAGHMNQRQRS